MYSISQNGLKLLSELEGVVLHPYLDKAKVPTIGIGTTFYPGGKAVTLKDPAITQEQAWSYAKSSIDRVFIPAITRLVTVALTQNQVDSLVSFCYNVGTGHDGFAGSHLLVAINSRATCEIIHEQFNRWIYVDHKPDSWQITRRCREASLFCS